MLIFKKNIYGPGETGGALDGPGTAQPGLDIPPFLKNCLEESQNYFSAPESVPEGAQVGDLSKKFPQSHRFGNELILQSLNQNILKGHTCRDAWYQMNAYHYCVLYDSILQHGYLYNHQTGEEKFRQYPELKGKLLRVTELVESIFFNTGFLWEPENFDLLTSCEKEQNGLNFPGLFGVIHGLAPAPNELELQIHPGYPYSITV